MIYRLLATASLCSVALVGMAEAQTSPTAQQSGREGAALGSDEIVVTARRREESLQSVPLAVSALSGADLEQGGVRNLSDLNARVPNLSVKMGNSDPQAAVFTIRGQSVSNQLLTVDSAVGVYQDNVLNPRPYGLLGAGLLDVQRVEVLRGPQGTLYGRNTTGGAVGIITNDPAKEFGGSVQFTGGNFGSLEATGVLNLPVNSELGFRFVGSAGAHDGYGDSLGPRSGLDEPHEADNLYLRGKMVATPGDFRVALTADYYRSNQGGAIQRISGLFDSTLFDADPNNDGTNLGGLAARQVAVELGLDPNNPADRMTAAQVLQSYVSKGSRTVFNTVPLYSDNSGGSVALSMEWRASDVLTLRSISGYRHMDRATSNDFGGVPFTLINQQLETTDDFYSQELQVLGTTDRFDFVAGLYYSREDGREFNSTDQLPGVIGVTSVFTGPVESTSSAVYAQGTWHVTDRLNLTGGVRYTREKKKLVNENYSVQRGCSIAPSLLDTPGVCRATFQDTFEAPTWLVSADYEIAQDSLIYARVGRGFKGGGQNQRATGTNLAVYSSFEPEYVTEYEVGVKTELFDRHLRLNLALFQADYTDAQRSVNLLVQGVATSLVTNAAEARERGVEIEANLVAGDFEFHSSVGYLDASYLKFADLTGDRSGEPFIAPEWNYTVGAQYARETEIGLLSLNANYVWTDDQTFSPEVRNRSQVTQPAFGLLNARAGIDFGTFEASLFVNNALDKKYIVAAVPIEAVGFNSATSGLPRVFGVQLVAKFGSEQ